MISLEDFLEIFENTGFSREQLVNFYCSVKKSIILSFAGKRAVPLLLRLDEKFQWPVLKEIDDPQLGIYREADDPELVEKFIALVKAQKQTKSHREKEEILRARLKLYKDIFDLTDEEVEACQRIGEEFERILRERRKKEQLKIGVGALAGAVLGTAAAGTYLWVKGKKQGKEEPKKGPRTS